MKIRMKVTNVTKKKKGEWVFLKSIENDSSNALASGDPKAEMSFEVSDPAFTGWFKKGDEFNLRLSKINQP